MQLNDKACSWKRWWTDVVTDGFTPSSWKIRRWFFLLNMLGGKDTVLSANIIHKFNICLYWRRIRNFCWWWKIGDQCGDEKKLEDRSHLEIAMIAVIKNICYPELSCVGKNRMKKVFLRHKGFILWLYVGGKGDLKNKTGFKSIWTYCRQLGAWFCLQFKIKY